MVKKSIITLSILGILTSNVSFAIDDVVKLNKGEAAPYTGVLMTPEKSEKIKDELIEKDSLTRINESYRKSIDLYKSNEDVLGQQKSLLMNQNIELSKALNDARGTTTWEKIGLITLGVAVAGFGVWGASRLSR